jgi:multidrug efflux pump subunit AcrA (membrane-fusion protein)
VTLSGSAGGKGVLFVINNGVAVKREVTAGTAGGELIEIISGLKAGEEYVVKGGFNLKDGDRVTVAKAGK